MKEITREYLTGERALFQGKELKITESTFADGESPLKESQNIALTTCLFQWKYPLWYSKNITLEGCTFFDTARAGVWYTKNISFRNSVIEAPKTFRRSEGILLENTDMPHAEETLWHCKDVTLRRVRAQGDYFAMNCENMKVDDFVLTGNYCFDGVKNATIRNARLLSKDAFWNSENITVYDSFIAGEYLGWNAKNLTFVNCTIQSLQGLCYIENLKMVGCRLIDTTLAFEYSTVDAQIEGKIDSVLNPSGGKIVAGKIDKLIVEEDKVDKTNTEIITTGCKDEV
jgi:hypothetical protein